jgi:choice-of-anchor B domain-containing protein
MSSKQMLTNFGGLILTLLAGPGVAAPGPDASLKTRADFGAAVAIADGVVYVGEPRVPMRPGTVYMYRRAGSSWSEVGRLTASDSSAGDGFGMSIDIDGNTMIVGALNIYGESSGHAYIFERDRAGAWRQVARFVSTPNAADAFGMAVALSGDVALVGAPRDNDNKGAVHVFHRTGAGAWSRNAKWNPPPAAEMMGFGVMLEVDGPTALVVSRRGMYEFRRDGTQWKAGHTFDLGGAGVLGPGDAVALSGETAWIGTTGEQRAGAVLEFQRDATSGQWSLARRITPSAGDPDARFGNSVVQSGERLWIGAPGENEGRGAVHVYRRDPSGWTRQATLQSADAQADDRFGAPLAASGNIAVVGMSGADFGAGKAAVFESDAAGLAWNPSSTLLSNSPGLEAVTGGEVRCESGKARIFECGGAVDLQSFLPIQAIGGGRGVELCGIWGWTDAQTRKEYALVGRVDGAAFVDVTDPARPIYVGQVLRTEGSPGSAWREIKTYKDHAYIVSDAARDHGMQVFNLARLREYRGTPITFKPDTTYHQFGSAHNIVINEETGFAYATGAGESGESCGGGLHMIDIREPMRPAFVGCFSDPQTGMMKTGYTHDAQCVLYHGPDRDYQGREICIGSNETAISIADVTDKKNPKAVSRVPYPTAGYTHQGWFTEDQRYFYVDDELDEVDGTAAKTRTLIFDLNDLDDPRLTKEFLGTTSASDHNLYIRGNLMYQANYVAGLRIIDITKPLEPVEIGFFDTVPAGENKPGFSGAWSNYPFFPSGTIVVSSIEQGLFVLRKRPGPVS